MSLRLKLDLGQGDFVLDGDHAPPPQLLKRDVKLQLTNAPSAKGGGAPHKFPAHVYGGQTAG